MPANDKSLAVNLAILDRAGAIASVNEGWKRFARRNGLRTRKYGLGSNYLEHCRAGDLEAKHWHGQIGALLRGEVDLVSFAYRCDSPRRKRAFVCIGAPLSPARDSAVVLLHLNVSAMLQPGRPASQMARAIETTAAEALSSHLAQLSDPPSGRTGADLAARLTRKERVVLKLLGEGRTNKEIAAALSRSPNTVKIHVSQILKKLNLRTRTEAALLSFQFNGSQVRTEPVRAARARRP
jgi:DNA-binding CsgD family transcriptional regulator